MTTFTDVRADVRTPDARAEAADYRRPRRNPLVLATRLRSPWWLVALTGATVSTLLALGAVSYAIPQAI